MIEILLIPAALLLLLVPIHAWFGRGILERGIIFTDLAIAQFAALGSAVSIGYFQSDYLYLFTFAFAIGAGWLIAFATTRSIPLEAFIGLMYVAGASGILMVLAGSAEGVEHFKSLLASDILFTTPQQLFQALFVYLGIALAIVFVYPRSRGFGREALFFSLLALTVTSSVELAGVMVVFVLLIAPIIVASMQRRFPPYPIALLFGWVSTVSATLLAFYADLPTGYTIVAVTSLLSLGSVIALSSQKT